MAMIGRALQRLIASPAIAGDAARTTAAAAGLCRHAESSVLLQRGALSGGVSSANQNYSTNNSGSGSSSSSPSSSPSSTGVDSDRTRNSNPDAQQMTFPMNGTLNKSVLLGYVGAEPRIKQLKSGRSLVLFPLGTKGKSIAKQVEQPISRPEGETVTSTEDASTRRRLEETYQWHRIAVYHEHYSQMAISQLRKGSKVYVEGLIEVRQYVDGAGFWKTVREIAVRPPSGMLLPLEKSPLVREIKRPVAAAAPVIEKPDVEQVEEVDDVSSEEIDGSSEEVIEEEAEKVQVLS